jgi:hypothetical protein
MISLFVPTKQRRSHDDDDRMTEKRRGIVVGAVYVIIYKKANDVLLSSFYMELYLLRDDKLQPLQGKYDDDVERTKEGRRKEWRI